MSDHTVKITVSGLVQMVGYRWFAKQQAELLGIRGYVRNCTQGEVEIVAQGKPADLEIFLHQIKTGPSRSRVSRIRREVLEGETRYDAFQIRG
ncbi:MAG: acylphosphatase [Candidatus Marinimicrobia bacterium]|nr:acylphosphatase [Candidatus Neomarinimicrobiota bacterium]